MSMDRRKVLAALAGFGASAAFPAWAQFGGGIKSQNDPWAQVDPYADSRNGFSSGTQPKAAVPNHQPNGNVFSHSRDIADVDEKVELARALGGFKAGIEQGGGLYPDAKVQQAIKAFTAPLWRNSDRPHLPWDVVVLRDQTINAWTCGAGKLAVNAGLLGMCDRPGELAAVLAHEIGHVDLAHSYRALQMGKTVMAADQRGMKVGEKIPVDVLIQGKNPEGLDSVADLLMAGYSRADETEADEHGLIILQRCGIEPAIMLSMLKKLDQHGMEHGHHLLAEEVLDHPKTPERIANVKVKIGVGSDRGSVVTLPGWDALKATFPTPAKFRTL